VGLSKSELRAEPRLAVEGRPLSWLSLRAATGAALAFFALAVK
jgi:hypothetical protein